MDATHSSAADLIVDSIVIVDAKVVSAFNDVHVAQMLGYLNITRLQVALLLNFKHAALEWKRIIRSASASSAVSLLAAVLGTFAVRATIAA